MGFVFKARGNASFGLFVIRLAVGSLFLFAGAEKALALEQFIDTVKGLGVFPDNLAFMIGVLVPFVEIFFGAMYIIGFFTPFVSFVLMILAIGMLSVTPTVEMSTLPFSRNWIILACTICTLFSGAGVISFDVFLDKKKRKGRDEDVVSYKTVDSPSTVTVKKVEGTVTEMSKPEQKEAEYTDIKKEETTNINIEVKDNTKDDTKKNPDDIETAG